ncbi:hypothetical protein NQ036_11280 [Brevibacterium sp. 91QC2O2]|jgi:hypothetical protein|uniref:hypothetical protein n=1 Tax=Brevibacterium TaxID=1696 RepID=UPI00211BF327|nr:MULTISPECIES: hypothetical protein [unclassified Brevibacterium]MCQ9368819.1 hypothetical protein [Brevibacterium sp. 91QC2O2]MCQ9386203.1 hypothetical protein [Brevibacterium sp. 68QC2CO]
MDSSTPGTQDISELGSPERALLDGFRDWLLVRAVAEVASATEDAAGDEPADGPDSTAPFAVDSTLSPEMAAEDARQTVELVEHLFRLAPTLDDSYTLARPDEELVEALLSDAESLASEPLEDAVDAEQLEALLAENPDYLEEVTQAQAQFPTVVALALDDYLQYLLELDRPDVPSAELSQAHDLIQFRLFSMVDIGDQLLLDTPGGAGADGLGTGGHTPRLADAFEEPPADTVLAATSAIKPVAAIERLLDWLGDGRPLSGAGSVQTADIESLAGLLGITADVRGVQSAWEVPHLAVWLHTLETSGVLEYTDERVLPGPRAESFGATREVERAGLRAAIVANYVEDVLSYYTYDAAEADPAGAGRALPLLLGTLTAALLYGEPDADIEAAAPAAAQLPAVAREVLARFVSDGVLVAHPDTPERPYEVPAGIAHAVADVVSDATEALWEDR